MAAPLGFGGFSVILHFNPNEGGLMVDAKMGYRRRKPM